MRTIKSIILVIVLVLVGQNTYSQSAYGCTTCSVPCGAACGFATNPTVAQVTAACTQYQYAPAISSGQTNTGCYTFTAANSTVSFNVIINSTCGTGNVSAFTWTLRLSSCGGILQSGNLSSLVFTGLTIGQSYTYCYTFTVPSPLPFGCSHSWHSPYFVGASPLPVELKYFSANAEQKTVRLDWETESERDNDYFTIERSKDGENFEVVSTIDGAGISTELISYQTIDINPFTGISYYRLKQTDMDGHSEYSATQSVTVYADVEDIFEIVPNPATENSIRLVFSDSKSNDFTARIISITGQEVFISSFELDETWSHQFPINLDAGIYLVEVLDENNQTFTKRLVVE